MLPMSERNWSALGEEEQLWMLKSLDAEALCLAARELSWKTSTTGLLGWVCAQRDLDLGTAMTIFLNGTPHIYNHADRHKLSEEDRKKCALLDAICQRINCGFYLPDPKRPMADISRFAGWMKSQDQDRQRRGKGRWVFNPVIVAPMISEIRFEARNRRKFVPASGTRGLLGGWISPLFA